ncbi:MAG TPA: hypothetical protein EYG31_00050 [Porticoccaceae bacterium]|jgi:type II secretory pathway pseudopilin PulG|nr:hypothetical protein [Gammaproteobacteria bacterium]HIL59015.1 hypothetical protein [Porticoccaceae bacterium]
MNKVLILGGVGALALYTIISLMDSSRIRQQRELEREAAVERATAYRLQEFADVEAMIDSSNADNQWGTKLCDSKEVVINKILTIDVEEAWIQDNPIYFSGSIDDVRGNNDQFYEITASLGSYSLYWNRPLENLLPLCYFLDQTFRLKLKVSKEMLNPHLERITSVTSSGFKDVYASYGLAAKINSVSSEPYLNEDGNRVIAIVGEGSLINIRPLHISGEPYPRRMTSEFPLNNTATETQPTNTTTEIPPTRIIRGDF